MDELLNCEDILMNFVVANATRTGPAVAFVRPRLRIDVSFTSGTHLQLDSELMLWTANPLCCSRTWPMLVSPARATARMHIAHSSRDMCELLACRCAPAERQDAAAPEQAGHMPGEARGDVWCRRAADSNTEVGAARSAKLWPVAADRLLVLVTPPRQLPYGMVDVV